jgi:hypothetical protein
MALLLIVATAVPALVRMTCLSGGHTELSFGQGEDCCPEQDQQDAATLSPNCCEFDGAIPPRSEFNVAYTLTLEVPVLSVLLSVGDRVVYPIPLASKRIPSPHPPPLGVLERLSQVRSFLI